MPYKKHIAASAAVALYKEKYSLDGLRCGLALYGACEGFLPPLKLNAPLLCIRRVKKGDGVGYGSEVLNKDTLVAVIGIGYADGFRRLSDKRYVAINGKKCEVLAVCMDVSIVDISSLSNDALPDSAEIIGDTITVNDLAKSYGTIPYEVFTGLGKRIVREYINY